MSIKSTKITKRFLETILDLENINIKYFQEYLNLQLLIFGF